MGTIDEKELAIRAKNRFLQTYSTVGTTDLEEKANRIGSLFKERGAYIGIEMYDILRFDLCSWNEYLKIGRLFSECIPFSNMEENTIIRESIVSWAKSCTIQAYIKSPIHYKFEAIEQLYGILCNAHKLFEGRIVKRGRNHREYASLYILGFIPDLSEIEYSANVQEKDFLTRYFTLSDIRSAYIIEYYLLNHLKRYHKILNVSEKMIEWEDVINKNLNHFAKFGVITDSFLNKLCKSIWKDFIKDDVERNFYEMGEDDLDISNNVAYYISFDFHKMEICWDSQRIANNINDPYNEVDEEECCGYGKYTGSYAQDEMGYSDDDIDTIFDGDPDAYWNID